MTTYELLLFLHISCVIAWLGAGTAMAVVSLKVPMPELGKLLGPRVFGPASLGALAFGLALVFNGNWTFSPLWVQLGLGAFALTTVLNVAVRLPLTRSTAPNRERKLRMLSLFELTVLYLTVADMVAKPTGDDVATLVVGGVILALVGLGGTARARTGRTRG